jgi:hypothetical protein
MNIEQQYGATKGTYNYRLSFSSPPELISEGDTRE